MANSVVRLSIDSHEFDANIKRAGEALNKFFDQAKKGDRTFEVIDDDAMEVVRAFGQMETKSKSASGQLAELTKGFTDLSLAYKRMTDEEKNSPVGKEITNQLDILKTRIQDTKGHLSEINGEINGGGGLTGALDQLAAKFGLNIQQLAGWGAAVGAAKVALDVSRDAFFQSESNIDDWERAVEESKGAYSTFLDTINSGNWSEFFSNMSTAVQGARDLFDALDRLGSIKSNNAAAIAIVQQQIAQLRLAKQQGENVDDQIKAATARLAELQGQSVSAGKSAGTLSIGNIIRSAYDTQGTGGKISDRNLNNVVNELLQEGQNAFDKYAKVYQRLEEKASDTRNVTVGTSITGATISATERYTNLDKLTEEERKQYTLSKAITEAETRIQKGISIYAQAVSEGTANAREEFKGNRYALSGSGGGKTGGVAKELNPMQQAQKEISALTEEALTADETRLEVIKKEIAALQEQVRVYQSIQDYAQGKEPNWNIQVGDRKAFEAEQRKIFEANGGTASRLQSMVYSVMKEIKAEDTKVDTETLHSLLKDALQNSIDTTSLDLTSIADQIGEGINVPDEKWKEILDGYNELREQMGLEPIKIDLKTGDAVENMKKDWKDVAGDVQSLGSALQGLEDPAAKVIGIIAQAIATVALTFAKSLTGTVTPWDWIAAAVAGTPTMISTITAIKSATAGSYEQGGIIPGNSYTGDRLTANVNSGELILSMAQQDAVANRLTDNESNGGVTALPFVTGEKIVLGVNNWARKTGRGELVFSKR